MKKLMFYSCLLLISISANAQVPSYVPTNGLVGYWPFNGNANDNSGNGINGTVNGAILTTDRFGGINSAYQFNGNETIIGNCSSFPSQNNPRTISLWYYANNITTAPPNQLMGYGGRNCGESWIMNFNNYDVPSGSYELQGHCLAFRNFTNSPLPLNNSWHQLIVSYDGASLRFYNDGLLVLLPAPISLNTYVDSRIFCFGKQTFTDGLIPYNDLNWPGFSGKLDDIAIWNRALSQQEITTLYNSISTGTNDIKYSNIKIYPNPTNNIINIEGLNKNENNTIQIFDVQGKLVITKTITEKGTIDLSELNKGVYVIKIGEVAQRIVKM
jgi:hypothetical protein